MEKIKTPLMLSIERKENKVINFRKEYDAYLELGNLDEMSRINAIVFELENAIEADRSILPTERAVIEKAFDESRLTHPMLGFKHEKFEDYFTQTFESYEKA